MAAEHDVLRLIDLEGFTQEEAEEKNACIKGYDMADPTECSTECNRGLG